MPQNSLAKLHEIDSRKSTEKLLLIDQNDKQKYSDKYVSHSNIIMTFKVMCRSNTKPNMTSGF